MRRVRPGYVLCEVEREDVFPSYVDFNADFLLRLVEAYPEAGLKVRSVLAGGSEEDGLKDLILNASKEELRRAVLEVLPERIYVFCSEAAFKDVRGGARGSVLPREAVLEDVIGKVVESWGPWFLRNFLETTYVVDSSTGKYRRLLQCIELKPIKRLAREYPAYFYSHTWMDSVDIIWVFTTTYDRALDPIDVANKLIDKAVSHSIFYYEDVGPKVVKRIRVNSKVASAGSMEATVKVVRLLNAMEDMFNPSVFSEKMLVGIYLGNAMLEAEFEDPITGTLDAQVDVYAFIYSNGTLAITYDFINVAKLLRKISLPTLLLIWKERDFLRKVSLKTNFNLALRLASQNDLTDLTRSILAQLMRESEHGRATQKLENKYFLNHPFIFVSPKESLSQTALEDKVKPLVKKHIRQAYLTAPVRNISAYDECLIYTDFNTAVIWNRDEVTREKMLVHKSYLTLLFTHVLSVRKGIVDTYYELEQLLYQPFSDETPRMFKQIYERWLKTIVLTKPERVLRSKADVQIMKNMFAIFRVDQLLVFINQFKEEISKYISWRTSELERLAIIILNILLSGSLAADITSILSPYIKSDVVLALTFALLWATIGATIYLAFYALPKIIYKTIQRIKKKLTKQI
ncbi:MAG TPA: hypothetical protein ENG27_00650 [Candidatus Bathyarchaeota archaeon]|nr:hypothetical protein [Candidatus Bathyarchaeota archaeon]